MKIKKWLASLGLIGLFAVSSVSAKTDPETDRKSFVDYFKNRHSGVEMSAYMNGAYALNQAAYDEWLSIEEFPPYELALGEGEDIWNTPLPMAKPIKIALTLPLKMVSVQSILTGMTPVSR